MILQVGVFVGRVFVGKILSTHAAGGPVLNLEDFGEVHLQKLTFGQIISTSIRRKMM